MPQENESSLTVSRDYTGGAIEMVEIPNQQNSQPSNQLAESRRNPLVNSFLRDSRGEEIVPRREQQPNLVYRNYLQNEDLKRNDDEEEKINPPDFRPKQQLQRGMTQGSDVEVINQGND